MLATLGGVLVALLALSGYVAASVYALARPWRAQGTHLRKIFQSLALGIAAQVFASPLTVTLLQPALDDLTAHPVRLATWGLVALLGAPIATGLVVARLVDLVVPDEPDGGPEEYDEPAGDQGPGAAAGPAAVRLPPAAPPRVEPVWTGPALTVPRGARVSGDPVVIPDQR